jgi:hypothetical protein
MSYKSLIKSMERNKTGVEEPYSHVSQIKPKGTFNFTKSNRNTMMDYYCDVVYNILNNNKEKYEEKKSNDEKEEIHLGYAEKPNPQSIPVIVDVDLKTIYQHKDRTIEEDEITPIYNEKHVTTIVQIFQNVIRNILKNCTEENLIAFILEKSPYLKEDQNGTVYIKNGFHIHFPYTFLNKETHQTHLIPRVRTLVRLLL